MLLIGSSKCSPERRMIPTRLDLSKVDAGKMTLNLEDFDISVVARDVGTTVEPLAAGNGNAVRVDCESAALHGDRMRVRQCLLNLLGNACKFTHGGRVALEGRLDAGSNGAWYVLRVTDTGIGIAADDIGRLFNDFSQVDSTATRKYGGTGLGLSISRNLCRLMGGDITMESVLGQGSTLTMRIPVETPSYVV